MLLGRAESSKHFHHIVYLFLFLSASLVQSGLFFDIEETPCDDELLAPDAL